MNINNPFGDNYPFIGPPGNDPENNKYVYDLYISYYDPSLEYKLPLKLVSISRTSIHVVDADGVTVFNNTSMRCKTWGSDYVIIQGVDYSKNLSIAAIVSKDIPSPYIPVHGELCLRCVYTQPKHITSFEVNGNKLKGDIIVNYGYNIKYTPALTDSNVIRPMSSVLIDATPGAGLGQTPFTCVQEQMSIKTINEVTADSNGNIYLYGDPCIKVSQVDGNTISVLDECIPCCDCPDFTRAATVMDTLIDEYYDYGAKAETIRDCALDLKDLLSCGATIFMRTSDLCPVRAYLDTTWPRHAGFTAEFRNVLPAIVSNLKVKVTVLSSPLVKHQALRTMYLDSLACDDVYMDTQDNDNYSRLHLANNWEFGETIPRDSFSGVNEWIIDWTDKELLPGATVWSTVAARNAGVSASGSARSIAESWMDSPDEPVTLTVEAQYDMKPVKCNEDKDILECLDGITINNKDIATGIIKGGSGFRDNTLDFDEDVKYKVKEICVNKHDGRWH